MDSQVSSDTPTRKRTRENETPSQRLKREKAAERQRRKRERDRNAANMGILSYPARVPHLGFSGQELTPEELARRERVRAAARERQRKHRQLVKQRKMRELGLDMGNDMMPGMEDYRVPPPDGHFHQVLPPELQPHPPPMGHDQPPPFPQGQLNGGRLFASTLLLSFSCDPLLKQHLMRTLHMTHEELASLEPVIADAWEHWDHQRRMHYAEKQAVVSAAAPDGSAAPNGPHPYPPPPPANGDHNEFRARFRSSIVPPSFPAYPPSSRVDPSISTAPPGSSGSASVASTDPIDPHLTGQPPTGSDTKETPNDMANKATMPNSIDPNLAPGKNDT
ncbi:hypothetical protein F5887DRAFT_1058498 [Amanita rubescens]|nr:hypothetical protein F5887DRAFT_1058498 [Amanita rubescens]